MCPGLTHPNAMMTPVEAGIVSNAALFCIFVCFFTHTAHAYSTFINSFFRWVFYSERPLWGAVQRM
jgi:hypothetical protein